MYLVSIYEDRRKKPVEIVLRREEEGRVNLTKIYYEHICEYHNLSPCTTIIC
jgi:glutamine amidotransferase-like uncharacterized protein